jgi:hypothetical protein
MYKDAFVAGRPASESFIRRQISLQSTVHSVSQETQHRAPDHTPTASSRVHSNPLMLVGAPRGDSNPCTVASEQCQTNVLSKAFHDALVAIPSSARTDRTQLTTVPGSNESHHVGVSVASTSRPNSNGTSSSKHNHDHVSVMIVSTDCNGTVRGIEAQMDKVTHGAGTGLLPDAAGRVAGVKLWDGHRQTDTQTCVDMEQTDVHAVAMSSASTSRTDIDRDSDFQSNALGEGNNLAGKQNDFAGKLIHMAGAEHSCGRALRTESESMSITTQAKSESGSYGVAECLCMSSEDDDSHGSSILQQHHHHVAESSEARQEKQVMRGDHHDSSNASHASHADAIHTNSSHQAHQDGVNHTGFREVRSVGVREYGSRSATAYVPLRAAFPVRQVANKTLSEDAGRRAALDGAPRCVCVCVYVCMHVCVCACVSEDAGRRAALDGAPRCVCVCMHVCMCE